MYILFRERDELNSAAPFALKKMLMLPRLNLCWRYYKRLQFLPPKHSLPYAIGTFFLRTKTFFSASPFFTCRTPAVPACPATLSQLNKQAAYQQFPGGIRRLVITAFFCPPDARVPRPSSQHRLFLPVGHLQPRPAYFLAKYEYFSFTSLLML